MDKIPVLISGAGPTGLMMGCQLALRGINFRIIDRTQDHSTQSRAMVIHARTMEIFQQMGLSDEFLEQGQIAETAQIYFSGKKALRAEVSELGKGLSDFPFILILEQFKTEQILLKYLARMGHTVKRNTELLAFQQTDSSLIATVRDHSQAIDENIVAEWIIGCDGSHSIVRESLGIPFVGTTYQQSLFVLDCKVEGSFSESEADIYYSDEAIGLIFPYPGQYSRVIGWLPEQLENNAEITFEEVNTYFPKQVKGDFILSDPQWISRYRTHHRVVSSFKKGRCFLAGDAAHIHSPLGGQGMNTGIQDAYNLAWKLSLVIQKNASESILDTYEEERIQIAQNLVRSTDRAFGIIASPYKWVRVLINRIVPVMIRLARIFFGRSSAIPRRAFKMVSEIGLNYRGKGLSSKGGSLAGKVIAGDRVPYYPERIEHTSGNKFHLLIFHLQPQDIDTFINNNLIMVHQIIKSIETKHLFESYGMNDKGMCLIRPDSYIAYKSDNVDFRDIESYCREIGIIIK